MKTQCIIREVKAQNTRNPEAIRETMTAVKSIPVDQKYIRTAADMVATAYANTQSQYINSEGVAAGYVMRYTLQLIKEGKIDPEDIA